MDVSLPMEVKDEETKSSSVKGISGVEGTVCVVPADHNEPLLTRRELWCYYLYANGNNGSGPFANTQILFQTLATAAGYDRVAGPSSPCTAAKAEQCVLPWGSGTKSVSSIVLIANGASFAIMAVVLTTFGSAADYGMFSRWLLLAMTMICWISQYACMALTSPSRWKLAMALYIIGFMTFGVSLVFLAAAFPRLAHNSSHSRKVRESYANGEISAEECEREQAMEKNRLSNISVAHNSIGWAATYIISLPLLLSPATATSSLVINYVLALDNTYSVLLGIWWFIYQLPRPGPLLPKGEHYLTIGWKQLWRTFKTCSQLPYTFVYVFASFLLADGFNTTATLVVICQNAAFNFSFLTLTYLGLLQAIASTISTFAFWHIQRHRKISAKTMLTVTNVASILVPLWGMIGIWTDKIGFHHTWEFWLYNVIAGLFQMPFFAFSQTVMAELCPPGFDNMFFGLFGFCVRVSAMIGPNVIQAIIDKTGSNWQGFPFLFGLCLVSSLVIWFGVDVDKGRRDAVAWASAQRS